MSKSVLDAALQYAASGLSIIAIKPRTKNQPIGKWKPYQSCPADESQLRKWFGNGYANNIAVILGAVSGNFGCRDFDRMESYDRWAADHPELAQSLPTAATSRGRHVYFRTDPANLCFVDLRTVDPPEDGE